MGVEININRLKNLLKEKRNQKPLVLFIDFSNTFNTVYHFKLFQKLREKEECIRRKLDKILSYMQD